MEYYKECGYDIQDGKAIIPESVTEKKDQVFRDCKEITSISFPASVKKIEGFVLRYWRPQILFLKRFSPFCHLDSILLIYQYEIISRNKGSYYF